MKNLRYIFFVIGLVALGSICRAQSIIPGKFKAYTQSKELPNSEIKKVISATKNFLGSWRDRGPPKHDTPSGTCNCRKYLLLIRDRKFFNPNRISLAFLIISVFSFWWKNHSLKRNKVGSMEAAPFIQVIALLKF